MRVKADIKEVVIFTEGGREIRLSWDEVRDVEKAIKFVRNEEHPKVFEYLMASF